MGMVLISTKIVFMWVNMLVYMLVYKIVNILEYMVEDFME